MSEDQIHRAEGSYNQLTSTGWNEGIVKEYVQKYVGGSLPLMRIQNVTKIVKRKKVLDNINFEIYPGEIFALIGLPGAGKTALLQAIVGYQDHIGDVLIKDKTGFIPATKKSSLLKNTVGFSPQSNSFYPEFTVRENLLHFGLLYGYGQEKAAQVAQKLIYNFQMQPVQNKFLSVLPLAIQKQVDIMCALIHDPQLVILDDPLADLDEESKHKIMKRIQDIHAQGKTILISLRQLHGVEQLCNRIGILHQGKLVKVGKLDELIGPFSHTYEIKLITKQGKYDLLAQACENFGCAIRQTEMGLIIYTEDPEKTLHEVGSFLSHHEDTILDMQISKPGIDEFLQDLNHA